MFLKMKGKQCPFTNKVHRNAWQIQKKHKLLILFGIISFLLSSSGCGLVIKLQLAFDIIRPLAICYILLVINVDHIFARLFFS